MISTGRASVLVGVALIATALVLSYIVILLKGTLIERQYHSLWVSVTDASGIRKQARVYLAGVEVGKVESVQLSGLKAVIQMGVRKDVFIPRNSRVTILSPGIAGVDKLVSIIPSDEKIPAKAGSWLIGEVQPGLTELVPAATRTLEEVTTLVRSLNEMVNDQGMRQDLRQALAEVKRTAEGTARLSAAAARMVESVQGDVRQSARNVNQMTANMQVASKDLPALMAEVQKLLAETGKVVTTAQHAMAGIDRVVSDPGVQVTLLETVNQVRRLTQQLTALAEDLRLYTSDPELRNDVKGTVSEVRAAVEEGRRAADRISVFVDRLLTPRSSGFHPTFALDGIAQPRSGAFRTDIWARVPIKDKHFALVGVYDVGEANRLTVQGGLGLTDKLAVRYGLYAGRAGLGLDYKMSPSAALQADFWRPSEPEIDIKAMFDLSSDWSIWLGMESLFRRDEPAAGFRIKF